MKYLYASEYFKENESIMLTTSVYIENVLEEHKHDFYEIAYITKGAGTHIINGNSHHIEKGYLLLIGPENVHNYYSDKNLEWINILFKKELIVNNSFTKDTNPVGELNFILNDFFKINLKSTEINISAPNMENNINEMLIEYRDKKDGYQDILYGYLRIILAKIYRTNLQQEEGVIYNTGLKYQVLNYLLNNSLNNLNISKISTMMIVSPRYFQTLFKKETGESVTSFIRRYKIEKACDYLRETNYTISKIMELVDMNDTKNFFKTFKNQVGVTPKEYRIIEKKKMI